MKADAVYEFGPFRQNAVARTLTREGTPIAMTPKAFDTLLYLVSHAGRTVSRDEIIAAVWPDTFVEEGNLTHNISHIRKALGDYQPGIPYIQTVPKQGYRFVAEVTEALNSAGEKSPVVALPVSHYRIWAGVLLVGLAATGLVAWSLIVRGDRPKPPGLMRLTSDSGLTMTPALSPDGRLIAYASDRGGDGTLDIWVQQVGGAEALRLTTDAADDYAPSFSPDGRTIAFRSERDGGGVYVISALGGEARKIAPEGRRPRFSPDGKWIAYWVGIEAGDTSSFFLVPGAGRIYIIASAGGSPHELAPEFAAAGYPIWTPDSKHVLFIGNHDPNGYQETAVDWWIAPIEGGAAVSTGANAAFQKLGLPTVSQAPEAWTADGAGVLFSATLADTRNVWRVPISPINWKVSGDPQRLTSGTIMDLQPSVADHRIAFASLNGTLDIWSLPLDPDRAEVTGDLQRLTQDAFMNGYPVVSADGTMLAFSSRRSGNREIWLKDLRTQKQRIISISRPALGPNFSPDGSMLFYKSTEKQSLLGYVYSVSNGGTERICAECIDYSWSSGQDQLLLVGRSPARVSILDLKSKRSRPLLDHASYVLWNARFSSDDRWVCFNATTSGRSRIFVAPVGSAGLIPQSEWIAITDEIWADKPRWSPDGNVLYFVSQRDGFRCIWAQRLDARKHPRGPAIPIFHAHQARRSLANVGIGDLGVSIARDKMVFNMTERTGNIWMTGAENQ